MKKLPTAAGFLIFLLFVLGNNAFSQTSMPNVSIAFRIPEPIKLDGNLTEKYWRFAPRITNFTQRELNEGSPVTERTEVAVVYTTESIFLGVWCYESEPDKLTAKYMQRDFPYWLDDNFEVIFDTYHDKRNGYVFVINPNGARSEVQITDEGKGFNQNWNTVWDAAVMVADSGWFAEIEIPFSSLKYPKDSIQIWGVNYERNIRRKQEQAFWQGWSRDYDFEHVSHAGTLIGLAGIEGSESVELKPFGSAGIELKSDNTNNTLGKIGGDINFPLTSTMKMNLTLNTDFAQVESDRAQINLSRFALYYPEMRDFFLEGKDFFEFKILSRAQIFYSRKIGIGQNGEIPILGGAKIAGKAGDANIGVMSLQTDSDTSEPGANYTVIRYRHDLLDKSSLGMILTARNSAESYNYVAGVDAKYYISEAFGDKNFGIEASVAQSHTKDMADSKNLAYRMVVSYPNDDISTELGLFSVQKNFNPEIGFLERTNFKMLYGLLMFGFRPGFLPWVHKINVMPLDVNAYYTDDTGELESFDFNFSPFGISTKSGEYITFFYYRGFDRVDDSFSISDDITVNKGKYWFSKYVINAGTYAGRSFSVSTVIEIGNYYNSSGYGITNEFSWSINKYLRISGDYQVTDLKFPEGTLHVENLGGRIDLALNPKLNSGIYFQWNNIDKMMILNFRLHWIPVVGSDFYLAINQFADTYKIVKIRDTSVLSKIVWRFAI